MATENEQGVTETVYPLRAHFLATADTKTLLRLLDLHLPLRCDEFFPYLYIYVYIYRASCSVVQSSLSPAYPHGLG